MTFETNKNLGGVGALLIVIGFFGSFVPYAGVLSLIGLILLLIGLKGMSSYYQEAGIFNNVLYAIIIGIVGAVVAVAVAVFALVAFFANLGLNLTNVSNWSTFGTDIANRFASDPNVINTFLPVIGTFFLVLVIIFVVAIIAAFLIRKSLTSLSAKTGVGLFGTAGLLMLIGAVLTIIVIGFVLIWIAWILVAVAFFQIRAQPAQAPPTPQPV